MEVIKRERQFCLLCMEEHEVQTVLVKDVEQFKGKEVSFYAIYEYCVNADEYLETEEFIRVNNILMHEAYERLLK
jgi:hypothetical protein